MAVLIACGSTEDGAQVESIVPEPEEVVWGVSVHTDPMDGTKTTVATTRGKLPFPDSTGQQVFPELLVRCVRPPVERGTIKVLVSLDIYGLVGTTEKVKARIRFDEGGVRASDWEMSKSREGVVVPWDQVKKVVLTSGQYETLHFDVESTSGARQYTQFNLGDSKEAFSSVIDACTLSGEELTEYNARKYKKMETYWKEGWSESDDLLVRYTSVYNTLLRVGKIKGRRMELISKSRPIPMHRLGEILLEYMKEESLCIFAGISLTGKGTIPSLRDCPFTFETQQFLLYFEKEPSNESAEVEDREAPKSNPVSASDRDSTVWY